MYFLRNYFPLLPALVIYFNSAAQQLGELDVHKGVAPFYLGSVRTQLDSSIRLVQVGKLDYKGWTEYNYSVESVFNQPYILEGVSFKFALLTYVSDTLIRVVFSNFYTPRLFPDFKKSARSEFRKLCLVLTNQWKKAGSKKTFIQSPDKKIISSGLQWDTDNARMKLALYTDKSKLQPLSDVSVTWELPGYD